jgi:3-hydroxyacyl-CoA dehydrogenase
MSDPVAAAAEADIVSESVPEDPALKGRVLGQFNELCAERTIFTTNTSTLLPSMFAAATGRPDRFAALHFHTLDDVGLDTVWDITDYWARQTGDPQTRTNADFVRGYLDQGRLGVKSGYGFYRYPNPAYQAPGFLESESGSY